MQRRILIKILAGAPAVLLAQENAEALFSRALATKDNAEAIQLLKKVCELDPGFVPRYQLAIRYNNAKQYQQALAVLREAYLQTGPKETAERARVEYRRAEAQEGLGELLLARRHAELSLALEESPHVRTKLRTIENRLSTTVISAKSIALAMEYAREFELRERTSKPPKIDLWVNFKTNEHSLLPAGTQQATALAEAFSGKKFRGFHYRLVGHTDRTGSDAINEPLSMRRAETVKRFLVDFGLPADHISVEGRGSREPLRDGDSTEDYAYNRRVEVILTRT